MYVPYGDLEEQLKCSFCKLRFDKVAKSLLCGESICLTCEEEIKFNLDKNNEFKCKLEACQKMHKMPQNGFPLNSAVIRMLQNIKPTEIYRGEKYENLKSSLANLKINVNEFNYYLENKNETIKDYCKNLRSEVIACKESFIEHIENESKKLLDEINKYEQELIDRLSIPANINNMKSLYELVQEINEFRQKCEKSLNENKLKEVEIDEALKKLEKYTESLVKYQKDFKNDLFQNKYLNFFENKTKENFDLGSFKLLNKKYSGIFSKSIHFY